MNQEYMKTRKILPLVLSMSLPMVISMAVNALYNIVDSYFVAKISEDAMTALALVFPVQNLVNAIVIGFAIGINARVAFYLGAKEEKLADESASVGLLLNLIHGLVLALLCSAIMPSFLRMFTGDTQVIALACTYSTRVFAFAPVIGLELAYEKIFQAVGRMKVSMICMMLGCVTNIILDPVMIFGLGPVPKLGIAGAAYATGIGQCVTLAGYLLFYFARPMHVKVNVANMKTTGSVMKNIYTIGIPATLNLALPSLLISALNAILASIQVSALNAILAPFPGSYILVLGVYYKLQTFIYLTANGIVQGIRPLVGYNYGAGEYDRVKKITHTSMGLIALVMVMGMAISCAIPQQLMGLFTTSRTTMEIGGAALRIISFGFVVSSVSVTFSGVLEGLGKGMPSLLISLARYIVVMLPVSFVLSRLLQALGVWYGFAVTEYIVAVLSYYIYKFHMRDIKG